MRVGLPQEGFRSSIHKKNNKTQFFFVIVATEVHPYENFNSSRGTAWRQEVEPKYT